MRLHYLKVLKGVRRSKRKLTEEEIEEIHQWTGILVNSAGEQIEEPSLENEEEYEEECYEEEEGYEEECSNSQEEVDDSDFEDADVIDQPCDTQTVVQATKTLDQIMLENK